MSILSVSMNHEEIATGNAAVCVTCGRTLHGPYCSHCGEKTLNKHDRRVLHLFEEFFHSLTHADSRFLRSMRYLFTKPGLLTNEYLAGRRKLYSSPLSLFLIANLLYLFLGVYDTFNSHFETVITGQPYSKALIPQVQAKMQKKHWTMKQLEERYDERSTHEAKLMLIVFVFLLSLPVALLFISRKRYYYDYVVFSMEYVNFIMYGFMMLIPWLLALVIVVVLWMKGGGTFNPGENTSSLFGVALLLLWVYLSLAARKVFKQQWWITIIKAALLTVCTVLAMFLYRFLAFEVTMFLV